MGSVDSRGGQVVGGRYRLIEKLGAGGFGQVWSARDEMLATDVAIKEVWLPPAMSVDEQAERLTRAEREARNAARLRDHPHIIAVHDVVIDGGPWIVMRLVKGRSLQERIDQDGRLGIAEASRVAAGILRALSAAHAAGIVHRDVKPANVMLTHEGGVLLGDFGIAIHRADTALTETGQFIGSIEYIAPERARGTDGLPASDLFSVGATLYQAVEGFSPFHRDTPTGALTAVLFETPPPPQYAGPLAPLLAALLMKEPGARPTAQQALAILGNNAGPVGGPMDLSPAIETSATVSASQAPFPTSTVNAAIPQTHTFGFPQPGIQGTPKRRFRKTILAAAGAAVLVVSGGLTWASIHAGSSDPSPSSEDAMAKCTVGTWVSNPYLGVINFNNVPVQVTFSPHTLIFNADGTGSERYTERTATGTAGGHQYEALQNGGYTFDYKNTFDLYADQNEFRIDYSGATGSDNIKYSVDGAVFSARDTGPEYTPDIATCSGNVLTTRGVTPPTASACHTDGGSIYCNPESGVVSYKRA